MKRALFEPERSAKKLKFDTRIDTVTCVWDIIFGFYGRFLKEFVVLAQTRKLWSLHRFGNLIAAKVIEKNVPEIVKFPRLYSLDIERRHSENQSPNTERSICDYMGTKTLALCGVNNLDLTMCASTSLKVCLCKNVKLPEMVEKLKLRHKSSTNFGTALLPKLTHLSVAFDYHFRIEDLGSYRNLEKLKIYFCRQVIDVESLKFFLNLRFLRLELLQNICGLQSLTQLTSLDVSMDCVDLWQIASLTSLKTLTLRRWKAIYGVSWLRKFTCLDALHIVNPQDNFDATWSIFGTQIKFRLINT